MNNILKVENLSVSFGGIKAVQNVDIEFHENKIVALLGANGAGKSTIMKTIMGINKADSGHIYYKDEDITNKLTEDIVASGITLVPEGRKIFPNLTVLENIKIGAYLREGKFDEDIEYVYSLFPILKERNWQKAGTLSGGEQQMLAVARALMSRPKLIIMDEPSLGLAPLIVKDIFEIIKTINKQGISVILVEQNANMALKIANYAYVIETGKITLQGKGSELLKNEKVKEAYLGKAR